MLAQQVNPRILKTPYHYSVAWDGDSESVGALGMPDVPPDLRSATARRRAEFSLGRYCAGQAIRLLDPTELQRVERQEDRSPRWPQGLVGSITHTDGFVSAAVARQSECLAIGIDSEKIVPEKIMPPLANLVVGDDERPLLARLPLPPQSLLILMFSAKESIYKCLYPLVNRPFDFTAIGIDDINLKQGIFHFRLTQLLHPDFQKSFSANGRFELTPEYVHTAVELPIL